MLESGPSEAPPPSNRAMRKTALPTGRTQICTSAPPIAALSAPGIMSGWRQQRRQPICQSSRRCPNRKRMPPMAMSWLTNVQLRSRGVSLQPTADPGIKCRPARPLPFIGSTAPSTVACRSAMGACRA